MSFRILCSGEILPGFDRQTVSQNIITRLGMNAEQAATLLSGREFVLKRGLSAETVSLYLQHLTEAGLRVSAEVEPAEPPAATPETGAPATTTAASAAFTPETAAPAAQPPVEEIECPRCHEKQPRRTLCRNCALDIPHFLASQQAIEAEQRAEAAAAREAELVRKGLRKPGYRTDDSQPPSLLGFSLSGRFSRRAYFLAMSMRLTVVLALMTAVLAFAGFRKFGLFVPIFTILCLIWSIRDTALRCHDLGWSGWISLLQFVPLGNLIFFLLMVFLPGQANDNAYGEPTPRTSWGSVLVGVLVAIFAMVCLGLTAMHQYRLFTGQAQQARWDQNAGQRDYHIVMYSLTTCSYCEEKRRQFQAEGIRFTEYFLDEDRNAEHELADKLARIGYHGAIATPSFEINGRLLMNNPPMERIHAAMREPTI